MDRALLHTQGRSEQPRAILEQQQHRCGAYSLNTAVALAREGERCGDVVTYAHIRDCLFPHLSPMRRKNLLVVFRLSLVNNVCSGENLRPEWRFEQRNSSTESLSPFPDEGG